MIKFALDISRLLSRSGEAVPTGIDRVELAYAEYLLRHEAERTSFAALHPLGAFGGVSTRIVQKFVTLLAAHWNGDGADLSAVKAARRAVQRQLLLFSENDKTRATGPARRCLYLLLSHHHLTNAALVSKILARRQAAFVPMVHDLIPSDYPEYARPNEPAKHLRRIATVAGQADMILVPSEVVRQAVLPHLHAAGRGQVPVHVARHGVHVTRAAPVGPRIGRPYFVCLGTIEPRKNHLLLLNVWRRLVERHGALAPKLILVGRRGWENENIVDMLDRCPALRDVVEEHNSLPDAAVAALLKSACALLMPSFVEGYGLPVAEALTLQVPVICSDIAIFHEVGGAAPVYLDPLDGPGWLRAIEHFCHHDGRHATELAAWRPLSWTQSIGAALHDVETTFAETGNRSDLVTA